MDLVLVQLELLGSQQNLSGEVKDMPLWEMNSGWLFQAIVTRDLNLIMVIKLQFMKARRAKSPVRCRGEVRGMAKVDTE